MPPPFICYKNIASCNQEYAVMEEGHHVSVWASFMTEAVSE